MSFDTKELSSLLHNQDATCISAISATLNASFDLTDVKYTNRSFGFYWGTRAESLPNNVSAEERDGSISADLLSLTPSTQYYYQAYIVLDGRMLLRENILTFTTKELTSLIQTKDAVEIKATSAVLSAKLDLTDVKYNGNIYYGFYWCRGRARGTTCSARIGTDRGAQMGTAYSAQ